LIVLACVAWWAIGTASVVKSWLRDFGKIELGEFIVFIIFGAFLGVFGFFVFGIPWEKLSDIVVFRAKKKEE
jgi:hypothetical protein